MFLWRDILRDSAPTNAKVFRYGIKNLETKFIYYGTELLKVCMFQNTLSAISTRHVINVLLQGFTIKLALGCTIQLQKCHMEHWSLTTLQLPINLSNRYTNNVWQAITSVGHFIGWKSTNHLHSNCRIQEQYSVTSVIKS